MSADPPAPPPPPRPPLDYGERIPDHPAPYGQTPPSAPGLGHLDGSADGVATFDGVPLASWGARVGAYSIDQAVAIVGFALGILLANAIWFYPNDAEVLGLAFGGYAVFWIAITAGVTQLTKGATLGKLLCRMEVVRISDGRSMRFGDGFVRDTLCLLPAVFCGVFSAVDSLYPLGPRRQSLRDKMAGTRVVQRPRYNGIGPGVILGWIMLFASMGAFVAWGFWSAHEDAKTRRAVAAVKHVSGPPPEPMADWTAAGLRSFRKDVMSGCRKQGWPTSDCTCAIAEITSRLPMADLARPTVSKRSQREIDAAWDACT